MRFQNMLHRHFGALRVVTACVVFHAASAAPLRAQAPSSAGLEETSPFWTALHQPSSLQSTTALKAAVDSSATQCMDVSWLAPEAVCSGRLGNALALAFIGASAGALDGVVGGWAVPTSCIGNYERAATRGAIAGAGMGALFGLVVPHISRREQAERAAREKAAGAGQPVKPWSLQDLKPLFIVGGSVLASGAAIGAIQGARKPSTCSGGVAGGAGTGAAVYGSGFAIGVTGVALGVRFLF